MRVLLTGANGYIGMRLLPVLIDQGHEVICCVRDKNRLEIKEDYKPHVEIFEVDFLQGVPTNAPQDVDVAYYLIHSMTSNSDFEKLEEKAAQLFVDYLNTTSAKQLIYLSGLAQDEELSKHLRSRHRVEEVLKTANANHTILRAGIIVGSGSASFEIIRDLVEKLPVMIAPKWLNTLCQPIAVRNVIYYLRDVMGVEKCYNETFDIGGPEVLTYKQMLLQFAKVRGFRRSIITVPVMTPRLSSYWLFFVTSTSYRLAVNLVNSMKIDVVVEDKRIEKIIPQKLFSYREAVELAFNKIEQNLIVSSWKDALVSSNRFRKLSSFIEVPKNGVYRDIKQRYIRQSETQVLDNIFSIGGSRGWYYGTFLWSIRGLLDKAFGGVGLRRGRTHDLEIKAGDALDFWRVLVADREEKRLLLYAEMKLPGDAWLEFKIRDHDGKACLIQTATFRPNGLWGRLYWYTILPFHLFIFSGMIRNIEQYRPQESLS